MLTTCRSQAYMESGVLQCKQAMTPRMTARCEGAALVHALLPLQPQVDKSPLRKHRGQPHPAASTSSRSTKRIISASVLPRQVVSAADFSGLEELFEKGDVTEEDMIQWLEDNVPAYNINVQVRG